MSEVNEAYRILSVPQRWADYDRRWTGGRAGTPGGESRPTGDSRLRVRPPGMTECMLCGHRPARQTTARRQVGMLFARRQYLMGGAMCRHCGQALLRDATSRTLWTGWWGVISVFTNFGVVFSNLNQLRVLKDMDPPDRREDDVVAPAPRPLDPGRPLHKRVSVLAFVAIIGLVLASGYADTPDRTTTTADTGTGSTGVTTGTSTGGAPTFNEVQELVGECFLTDAYGEVAEFVSSCAAPHDLEVLDVTFYASGCPQATTAVYELDRFVICAG